MLKIKKIKLMELWPPRDKRAMGIWAGALTVVVIILMLLLPGKSGVKTDGIQFHTVKRGDLMVSVTESGSVKARDAVEIKSLVEGQTTLINIVPEGTFITEEDVANGKVLVELDTSGLKQKLTQQEIQFANEESSYTDAKEEYNIRVKQNESDINTDQQGVKFCLLEFQKYLGETVAAKLIVAYNKSKRAIVSPEQAAMIFSPVSVEEIFDVRMVRKLLANPDEKINGYNAANFAYDPELGGDALQKKRTFESQKELADEEYKRSQDQLDWTKKLFEKQYASRGNLEADQLAARRKQIELEQAKTAMELFLKYEFPKEAEDRLGKYNESQMKLERTYAEARSKLTQAVTKLRSSEARYMLQKEELGKLYKQYDSCTIRAPKPGLVVYANTGDAWRQREPMEPGASIRERQVIMTLPNASAMAVEMKVHETNVDKVKPGLPARITIDAFPDKELSGEVIKVSLLPDQTRSFLNPDLKVYATDVNINGENDFLKPGMSAKVEVIINELMDVVTVPVQAVVNRDGAKYCYVKNGQNIEAKKVKTGAFNDALIEVQDGLKAGDEVAMNPPRIIGGEKMTLPGKSNGVPRIGRRVARQLR